MIAPAAHQIRGRSRGGCGQRSGGTAIEHPVSAHASSSLAATKRGINSVSKDAA
jgi:hypothetical protein